MKLGRSLSEKAKLLEKVCEKRVFWSEASVTTYPLYNIKKQQQRFLDGFKLGWRSFGRGHAGREKEKQDTESVGNSVAARRCGREGGQKKR